MIAEAIKFGAAPNGNNPPKVGTYDWKNVEFTAYVVRNGSQYSAGNNSLYSNGYPDAAFLPLPSNTTGIVEGIVHNHPDNNQDQNKRKIDRYPSPDDWSSLQDIKDKVAPHDTNYDPFLWVTDSTGVTREFRLSERSSILPLTPNELIGGVGLDVRVVREQCGDEGQ